MAKNKKKENIVIRQEQEPQQAHDPKLKGGSKPKFEVSLMILGSRESVEAFNLRLRKKIEKNHKYLSSIDNPNIKWGIPDKRVCRQCGNIWTASLEGFRFANHCNECAKPQPSI